jgi:hypothetical protein
VLHCIYIRRRFTPPLALPPHTNAYRNGPDACKDRDEWPPPGQCGPRHFEAGPPAPAATLLRPPRPALVIAHQPSLTNCFFHSSADIGSSLMAYRARTWTWSVTCRGACRSRRAPHACRTSSRGNRARSAKPRQPRGGPRAAATRHFHERLRRALNKAVTEYPIFTCGVWGPGHLAAIVSLVTHEQHAPDYYKRRLVDLPGLSHITIEVVPCPGARP